MTPLTYRIFDIPGNLKNMGGLAANEPKRSLDERMREDDPFKGINFEEIDLDPLPTWERANVNKINGMLRGFYQASLTVLKSPAYDDGDYDYSDGDLVFAINACQRRLSLYSELRSLAKAITTLIASRRFLSRHFVSDQLMVNSALAGILSESKIVQQRMHNLQAQLLIEDAPSVFDPSLDPRLWRSRRFYTSRDETKTAKDLAYAPPSARHRGHRAGKKGRRYSAARKRQEAKRLDWLAFA